MNRQRPALLVLCLLAFAGTAGALETDELIAISAMPLAVADVIAIPDVPQAEVVTVVTTLNHAAVPAPQFVEIVRYIPVALAEPAEPRFSTFVTQEYSRGVVGQPLALAIADRYDTYGYDEVEIVNPPVVTYVERRQILPQMVVTRYQPVEFDPLALIAMPLAVAAVADIADVPATDLMRFVTSLNQARVPAPQFVEVVRYSPVVLVDRTASPQFLQFVTTDIDRGLLGLPLAFSIANRIETFEPVDIDLIQRRPVFVVDRTEILPPVVSSRVASSHPHGGPPGQLKKQLGVQTGAEVVHGTRPKNRVVVRGDDDDRPRRVTRERPTKPKREVRRNDDNRGSERRVTRPQVEREQPRPQKMRGSQGGGQGKAKGKGKGKG